MAIGREQRMASRRDRIVHAFGDDRHGSVVAALALLELAWHDCHGEVSPPEDVIDDVLLVSGGSLDQLVSACLLAVTDRRDLSVAADELRG